MNAQSPENLDIACALTGKKLAKLAEKSGESLLNDALCILEEQGVYALFLFLSDSGKKVERGYIKKELRSFLQETPKASPLLEKTANATTDNNNLDDLAKLSKDIDKLLEAHDLLRQTLVYARYHAKAAGSGGTP